MTEVSIIVPNYNHARFLKQRLDSIFNQTYQDFEVILLDDASTDNSVEVLKTYASHPKVTHFIINKQNSGSVFKQWKKGIDHAKGEFVWIAESDDWAEERFLEVLIGKMRDSNIGFTYCRSSRANRSGEKLGINRWGEELDPEMWEDDHNFGKNELVNKYLQYRNVIPNISAVLLRKNAVSIDDFICSFKLCGDWALYVQIASNYTIKFVSAVLNNYRRYSDATTFSNISLKKERIRLREYFQIIHLAQNLTGSNISLNSPKYHWICNNWINNKKLIRKNVVGYLFPTMPINMLPYFYMKIIRKMFYV